MKKIGGYKFHKVSDLGSGYSFGYDEPIYYYQLEYKDILFFLLNLYEKIFKIKGEINND